jgi:hypothetical protein
MLEVLQSATFVKWFNAAAKRRVKETYTRWDPAENLKSEADIRAYLIASFEEAPDDAAYIAAALGDVARAHWLDTHGAVQGALEGRQPELRYRAQGTACLGAAADGEGGLGSSRPAHPLWE